MSSEQADLTVSLFRLMEPVFVGVWKPIWTPHGSRRTGPTEPASCLPASCTLGRMEPDCVRRGLVVQRKAGSPPHFRATCHAPSSHPESETAPTDLTGSVLLRLCSFRSSNPDPTAEAHPSRLSWGHFLVRRAAADGSVEANPIWPVHLSCLIFMLT